VGGPAKYRHGDYVTILRDIDDDKLWAVNTMEFHKSGYSMYAPSFKSYIGLKENLN